MNCVLMILNACAQITSSISSLKLSASITISSCVYLNNLASINCEVIPIGTLPSDSFMFIDVVSKDNREYTLYE